jgi:hypothetical protein
MNYTASLTSYEDNLKLKRNKKTQAIALKNGMQKFTKHDTPLTKIKGHHIRYHNFLSELGQVQSSKGTGHYGTCYKIP